MRVFLTGATGFVGSHVLPLLLEQGHEVRALRRSVPPPTGAPGLAWVEGDLLDPASVAAGIDGCEAVIHTAAMIAMGRRGFAEQREVNVVGTHNVVRAAQEKGVRRFVHTSSISALGRPAAGALADESQRYDWPPGFNYPETKRDSEREAIAAASPAMEVVSLNPALILGPAEPHRRSLAVARLVKRRLALFAPPGGTSICDVRDVAEAHLAALTRGRSGERYLLAGPYVSYHDMLSFYARALGVPPPVATVPVPLVRLAATALRALEHLVPLPFPAAYVDEYVHARAYTSKKAIAELGYRERPADRVIADTVAWYRSRGEI